MVVLRCCFNLACLLTAFGMTMLWLYRYYPDEDIVKVDFKPYDKVEGKFPMPSFCLLDPVIEPIIKPKNDTLTARNYTEILIGHGSYEEIKDIDFDNVTFNLADIVIQIICRYCISIMSVMKSYFEMDLRLTNKSGN